MSAAFAVLITLNDDFGAEPRLTGIPGPLVGLPPKSKVSPELATAREDGFDALAAGGVLFAGTGAVANVDAVVVAGVGVNTAGLPACDTTAPAPDAASCFAGFTAAVVAFVPDGLPPVLAAVVVVCAPAADCPADALANR